MAFDVCYFHDFEDVDALVDAVSGCCKRQNIDPMSPNGRKLIRVVLNRRRLVVAAARSREEIAPSEYLH
ncbi:hypothetical protein CCGE531_31985 (plasmid) [Rhizobium sp. CCGE531]|nr:hypothetical protein CCGE531_31985 [Rhizobium sp. CCGE531]